MAECDVSIDQKKLPGVKEVCRDFAVLEDHSLAYNLQEQEIESHLASNVHKNRLVQKDLIVAKKLQEEEDEIAKIKSQKQHGDIERQDNEIAQEIQEELIRQAELQRLQEEKDAAIARKLQEKEMKEERRRKKQQESNVEEDYFEDHGAGRTLDVDKCIRQKSRSPDPYGAHSSVRSGRDFSPEYYSTEPKRSRYPRQDSAAPQTQLKNMEYYSMTEGGRSRHADTYPEHLLPSRSRHGDRNPVYEHAHTQRAKTYGGAESDGAVRKKEKPERPPPPQNLVERDKTVDRERNRHEMEREAGRDTRRGREQHLKPQREKSTDGGHSGDRQAERDRRRPKQQGRGGSRERGLEEDFLETGHSKDWLMESSASWEDGEERRDKNRPRVYSIPNEPHDKLRNDEGQGDSRESWESGHGGGRGRERSYSTPTKETGRPGHRGGGAVIGESAEFGLSEATQGLTKLDLREQELRDMEVAKKLQEEELKANSMHVRAAQVAQDEEIARILMEQEKKEYRKIREREKEKAQERERMAMERRRQEGEHRPKSEDVVRPRTREDYDYQRQKNHSKPARPPQPRIHDYENVGPGGYGYPDHPVNARPHTRPEAAYKGAYQKR
ncbi:coiled-coil domain-containing protein 50 isoform X1 [Oryzias melastigma]|nr:coiled-coil domain-containing protein 50 isoform X1 [Oryzias melastigma]